MFCSSGNESAEQATVAEYAYFFGCGWLIVSINWLVLYIAARFIDVRAKPNQMFVVSMTTADMLFGVVYLITRPFVACIPTPLCGPYYVITWMCQLGSVLFLLCLNVDKFISIRFPLHYHSMATERTVCVQTLVWSVAVAAAAEQRRALSWSVVVVVSLFSFYGGFVEWRGTGRSCMHVTVVPAYYLLLTLLGYVAPTVVSLAISIYIFIIAQTISRRTPSTTSAISGPTRGRKDLMKRILFVFSSTMWTSATYLPYRLAFVAYLFCVKQGKDEKEPGFGAGADQCANDTQQTFITYMLYVMVLGALGNPLVTLLTQRAYRGGLARLVAIMRPRRHDSIETRTENIRLRSVISSPSGHAFDVI